MDFASWDDWVRAVLGAGVTGLVIALLWRGVTRWADYGDPHRRTGRRILLVPRLLVRARPEALRPSVRAVVALRRHQGVPGALSMNELLARLVEADRAVRVLKWGRRVWAGAVPGLLLVVGIALGAWVVAYEDVAGGRGMWFLRPVAIYDSLFGQQGFIEGSDDCIGWSLLLGCEPEVVPWWSGAESGFVFGVAVGLVVGAWRIRRAAVRDFAVRARQEPPLSACLAALGACREALRTPAPEASVLDAAVAELRAALMDFARCGPPADAERRAELEEHAGHVAATLHEASGRVLREGAPVALPALVRLLAQLQDRLHASRWLALLDASLLAPAPPPPPGPVPAGAAPAEGGRWQRYMAVATALPAIPALLALVFTAVTISQARDTLRITERGQIASSYNDTVANLGDDSVDVRTSSIFALKRIMEESPREQPAIVEILSAYVRDKAKTPSKAKVEAAHRNPETRPPEDVQAALKVLGSRPRDVDDEGAMDLRRTFLVGADFADGDFRQADFRGADLTFGRLGAGEFMGVDFSGATLRGAALSHGLFYASEFVGADMADVVWDGAEFQGANLSGADLRRASYDPLGDGTPVELSDAEASGANLTDADLTGALLVRADLGRDREQKLPAANLTRTDFTRADLTDARLDGADRGTAVWTDAKTGS
ncbi:pentapeptide repeat-containing protein [Streptomyces sp. NPDC059695]|uniref:pentapeptide repeat-containing protein n=1 Tax=Streptomyces sp. NPDC059695 TaxID=3346910 RepID=UPI003697678B